MADGVSRILSAAQTKTFSLDNLDHRDTIKKFNIAAIPGMLCALMKQEDAIIMIWLCDDLPSTKDLSIEEIHTYSLWIKALNVVIHSFDKQ